MATMMAARLHQIGEPLRLDQVTVPVPGPGDVVVAVKACNIVPNLKNVLGPQWSNLFPELHRPKLPAIFGLDVAGIVAEVGKEVWQIHPGDRVYVNPARGCGSCRACRGGDITNCANFTYQGYFDRGPLAEQILAIYPYGGLAEYTMAPQSALVKLPDSVTFEEGARLGYLGTAYSALKKAGVGPARTVLINGIGGTLGLGGALLALAIGATRILGTGRNSALLERVKAIAPHRIEVLSVSGGASIEEWARSLTEGEGVDAVIDCLPPRSPHTAVMAALRALRPGGRAIDVGASSEPLVLDSYFLKSRNAMIGGSRWFTTAEGEEMAVMTEAGTLDLKVFQHRHYPLTHVNEAIAALGDGNGGFSNFLVGGD